MSQPLRSASVKVALGCGAHLVLLAALAFGIDQLTSAQLPRELRLYVVLPAALLLTVGLSNVWSLAGGHGRGHGSRAALLARARTGEPPPQDGPIVITGIVRAEGATLRAPISGVECVAYQYRLYTSQWLPGQKHRELPIFWGYACRPFRLDTPRQAYRVVAVPQLADAPVQHQASDARARANAYVAATRYEPKRALAGLASATVTMFGELIAEPSGDVRRDWQAPDVSFGIDELLMEEIVVPIGATVSVSGRWSIERRAIVPGQIDEGGLGVTLVTGPAEALGQSGASELPSSALSVTVMAAVSLLLGAGLVWLSRSGQIADWWRAQR